MKISDYQKTNRKTSSQTVKTILKLDVPLPTDTGAMILKSLVKGAKNELYNRGVRIGK